MNEQFRNRKHASIKSLLQKGELLVFSDQQNDGINITNMNITTSSFLRLGMKEASLNNCSFTQSNFEHCYFRNAKFNTVRFTGSCFIHCNFDKATFQSCDFRYCSFYFCKLPKEEIISCLPPESNLKCDLARNLRVNSEMIGDKKTADEFLKIEIRAGEEERKAIFLSKT